MTWNPEDIRAFLKGAAVAAESYAFALRERKSKPEHWTSVYDEHLAKFAAYDTIGFAAFESRRQMTDTIEARLNSEPRFSGAFDAARAKEYYCNHLRDLLAQYSEKQE